MIKYKIDVIETLKESGYNTTKILKERLISQATMQKLRNKEYISMESLDKLCRLMDMQPGNIIKYVEEENNLKKD